MNNRQIGQTIRSLRKANNITQKELGKLLGYSEAHISNLENGNRGIDIGNLHKIANIFKVGYEELLSPIHTNHHFRSTKTEFGKEILNDTVWEDFKSFARDNIKNKDDEK